MVWNNRQIWLVTVIPEPNSNVKARYQFYKKNNKEKYQVDYIGAKSEIPPNQTITITNKLYAGAKEVKLLDKYYRFDCFCLNPGWQQLVYNFFLKDY